jgi:rubredoxin
MLFVGGSAVAGLSLWRTARRDWRCPACDVRWESQDALAAGRWNHCAACGVELRANPHQAEKERLATTEFEFEDLPHPELVARFRRRRRLGLIGLGASALLLVAALAVAHAQGWGKLAQQGIAASFTGVAVAVVATTARCPRCRVGILASEARHLQRCGFVLVPGTTRRLVSTQPPVPTGPGAESRDRPSSPRTSIRSKSGSL